MLIDWFRRNESNGQRVFQLPRIITILFYSVPRFIFAMCFCSIRMQFFQSQCLSTRMHVVIVIKISRRDLSTASGKGSITINNQFRSSASFGSTSDSSAVQTAIIIGDSILVTSAVISIQELEDALILLNLPFKFCFIIAKNFLHLASSRSANSRCAGQVRVCVATCALRLQSVWRVVTCCRLIVPIHACFLPCRAPCPTR